MSNEPLDRYAACMQNTDVPAHLPDLVLERARAQRSNSNTRPTPQLAAPAPAFSVKRFRFRTVAIAACTVLALGAGVLTLGPISAPANDFQMAAFAGESGGMASGLVTLAAEDFMPVRASVGPVYDSETDSYTGEIEASRSYNLDLTCTGNNVTSMTYELQGEGVDFFNWELTYEGDAVSSDGSNITGATGDNDNSFTIDYVDQDINTTEAVNHEIYLNYTLDDQLKAAWDEFYTSTSHERIPRDSMPEEELLAWTAADDKLDLALAQHDAEVIANARLILTATFADGTTQTKTYRLAPVANFAQAYSDYQAMRSENHGSHPQYPALYTIEEIA